ncbi:MAG: MiaB/RimO family radical SAM methylthiotransferase, partial [Candidatus Zixiibacteriota bacterium]
TGCYAEVAPHRLSSLRGVDLVVGNDHKDRLAQIVEESSRMGWEPTRSIPSPPRRNRTSMVSLPISGMRGYTRAFIKIQDGCNFSCSYCIIPRARGSEVSKPFELVLEEAGRLADSGYREIVLTGIHIGRYGDGKLNLTRLLEKLLSRNPLVRFRLSSIEPQEVSGELLQLLSAHRNLCPHLHLAIQSADGEVIKAMNRHYTPEFLRQLLERIVVRVPGITVGADFIVGFPGETKEQFLNTLSFVKRSPLAYLHVFSYSDRPGTAASAFENKVTPEEKSGRSRELIALGRSKRREHLLRFRGRELEVLIESRRHRQTSLLTGISDNYLRVVLEGADELQRQIGKGNAQRLLDGELLGEVVQDGG